MSNSDNPIDMNSPNAGGPPQANPYMSSMLSTTPVTRAVTINIENEHNLATAYPSRHVSLDVKKNVPQASFGGVRFADLNSKGSATLASSTAGKPNKYRSRASMAAKRLEQGLSASSLRRGGRASQRKIARVDAAPGRGDTSGHEATPESKSDQEEAVEETRRPRRGAAIAGEKKRKRASRGEEVAGEEEVGEEPENEYEQGRANAKAVVINKNTYVASMVPDASVTPSVYGFVTSVAPDSSATLSGNGSVPTMGQDTAITPSGFPRVTIFRKREGGIKVPKSFDTAGEADRMLWEWKHDGKPWTEITQEWTRLTGKAPGKSSLSVRFIKLEDNFATTGGADDIMLLRYKEEALAEMEPEMWKKVAAKIKTHHDVDLDSDLLRKRYNALKATGFEVGAQVEANGDGDKGLEEAM